MSAKLATVESAPALVSVQEADPQAFYLESLSNQLTGWDDPHERVTRALRNDEFLLFAQNIIALSPRSGVRSLLEILVRLEEEERNLTPPGAFIPIMEYYDMMPDLDRWIVDHVISWCADRGPDAQTVCSINLSGGTISDVSFPNFVRERIAVYNIQPQLLCFEVSESDAVTKAGVRFVTKIKAMGCLFAIGSFGRGIISFDALRSASAHFIKIDGNIVREMARDPVAAAKVKAITRVCEQRGIITIAEFVETPEILNMLREIGVNYAQGFGISRPAPLGQFA